MSEMDLQRLFLDTEKVERYREAKEAASAKMTVAKMDVAISTLLSRHYPLHPLGIDRQAFRLLASYIHHGDLRRLDEEVEDYLQQRDGT